ncbi:MAG: hypothetical protein BJ554DRAFT_8453 [Olpidium bornovanus]|uniref:Uncharacterized protein n=1 Tax=Olpidium bornovanus TaxID=278681 RepID=A0A8H7ZUX1_9FUNG|nr:MAG: hypothetical protein BJ554DRAFT_8453 [Olpidium bornovanus]
MSAAVLGARVTLTDAPVAVDALRWSVQVVNQFLIGKALAGGGGAVENVSPLDWTDRSDELP